MTFRKTEAITIYQKDYSESSQIITFYTSDYGKITVRARGIKRQKNRYLSPPDLFSHNEIVFLERSPEGVNLLTEIIIKDNFPSLRLSLERMRRAFYLAEFLDELTDPGEPNRELFDLSLKTIRRLSMAEPGQEEKAIFSFEAQALKYLGYMPNTFCCVICGKSTEPPDRRAGSRAESQPSRYLHREDKLRPDRVPTSRDNFGEVAFSFYNGSVVCSHCRDKEPDRISRFSQHPPANQKLLGRAGLPANRVLLGQAGLPSRHSKIGELDRNDIIEVSAGIMKLMHILGNPFLPDLERLKISGAMQLQLRGFINKYISYITGKRFNTMRSTVYT